MSSIGLVTKGMQSKVKEIGPLETVIINYPLQGIIEKVIEFNGIIGVQYQLEGIIDKEDII